MIDPTKCTECAALYTLKNKHYGNHICTRCAEDIVEDFAMRHRPKPTFKMGPDAE